MMPFQAMRLRNPGGSGSIAASILGKLTSYWDMSEASGARLDSKGANHLSVVGTVNTAAGSRGSDVAAAFVGTGGLVAPNDASLNVPAGGGNHCFFGWLMLTAPAATQFAAAKWNASGSGNLEYAVSAQAGVLYAQNGGVGYTNASTTVPAANTWSFVVMWRDAAAGADAGKVRIQRDEGTIALSASASNAPVTASSLGFGQAGSSATNRLTGRLQRWGWIKGDILTPAERAWLYNGGAGRTYAEIVAAA
ncbi:hypothetical protein ACYX7E_09870 [Luteimonas sp. RIT-PG2_3]